MCNYWSAERMYLTSFPPPGTGCRRTGLGFFSQIRIRCLIGLSTEKKTVHTSIPPLLFSGSRTVTRTPGGHPPIEGLFNFFEGYTCSGGFLLQGCRLRKEFPPAFRIGGTLFSCAAVSFESSIGSRVLPVKLLKMCNLLGALSLFSSTEPSEIFGWPEFSYHLVDAETRWWSARWWLRMWNASYGRGAHVCQRRLPYDGAQ